MLRLLLLILTGATLYADFKVEDPYVLMSKSGVPVTVVAVYSIGPDSLTFSPRPTEPLVGNNKIGVVTTSLENIDLESIKKYKELRVAIEAAEKGVTSQLNVGPHFFSIEDAKKAIESGFPSIRVSSTASISLKDLITDSRMFRKYGNYANSFRSRRLMEDWQGLSDELHKISYRADVISFRRKLRKAVEGLKKMAESDRIFNSQGAADILSLLR